MTITDAQNERLTDMLSTLQGELNRENCCITGNAASFVKDQIARHAQYGNSIRLSPKQWRWLEDIYSQVSGEDKPQDDRGDLEPVDERMERTTRRRTFNDNEDIPF